MNLVLICLFIATLMPVLSKAPLALAMARLGGGYNNRNPRGQQAQLTGFGARAKAAHENSFEALIMFAPGALACIATEQTAGTASQLALAFVIARVAYLVSYWCDWHLARSGFWGIGFICSLALILMAA